MDERVNELLNRLKVVIEPGDDAGTLKIVIPRTKLHGACFTVRKGGNDIEMLENAARALRQIDTDEYAKEGIRNNEPWTRRDLDEIAEAVDRFDDYLFGLAQEFEDLARTMKNERGIRDVRYDLQLFVYVNGKDLYSHSLTDAEKAALRAEIEKQAHNIIPDSGSHKLISGRFAGGKVLESAKGPEQEGGLR